MLDAEPGRDRKWLPSIAVMTLDSSFPLLWVKWPNANAQARSRTWKTSAYVKHACAQEEGESYWATLAPVHGAFCGASPLR